MVLDYKEHDFMVGSVSHLPHVISATLVNLVKHLDNADGTMRTIAAGGFKDITRISSSSPLMWEKHLPGEQTADSGTCGHLCGIHTGDPQHHRRGQWQRHLRIL